MPGRREEKNITEGACAQAKLFLEHISWMAQLMHPDSLLPAFPAKLFLPPLDGGSAALTPLCAPGIGTVQPSLSLLASEPFTTQAARAVTNRASIDI